MAKIGDYYIVDSSTLKLYGELKYPKLTANEIKDIKTSILNKYKKKGKEKNA